jgi:hypothetical protein
MKEYIRPVRIVRFLEISRVNSVVPDKYRLGLQPMSKLEVMENSSLNTMNGTIISLTVTIHCQTEGRQH